MYSLTVKNNRGDELNLTRSPDYTVYRVEGLAPPPATINSSANTTIDGSKINSVKLESRNIVIYAKLEGDIEASRIALYKYFPLKQNVTVYFKNGRRNVHITGAVESLECDLFENPQTAQISILCPYPYFKDVNDLAVTFSDVTPAFTFPFSVSSTGKAFSTYIMNNRKLFVNTSDIETGLIIKLYATGTVVKPTIYEIITGRKIRLNMTMQAGDTLIIDTTVYNKSITLIRNGVSTNALGYMIPDSDWLIVSAGDNVFTYECESGASSLQITLTAPVLYSGV